MTELERTEDTFKSSYLQEAFSLISFFVKMKLPFRDQRKMTILRLP